MRMSRVVEIEGVFVGAAIDVEGGGFRFVPVDGRLRSLTDRVCPSLAEVQRLARQLLHQPSAVPVAICA